VDDHGHGLALVELGLRAACESKRRERDRRDQSYSGHGLAPPVRAFVWRIREPRTRSAPSPVLRGRGEEGGERTPLNLFACPSLTLPRMRGRERTEHATSLCLKRKWTRSISSRPNDRSLRAGTARRSACRFSRREIGAGPYCRNPPCPPL